MKILLIHHVADLYGSSRSLLRLATRLVADGHTVRVVLQEDGPLRTALESAGVAVRRLPALPALHRGQLRSIRGVCRLLRQLVMASRWLRRWMREDPPDLVHSNSATLLPVAGRCARRLGIPHIQHVREFFAEFGWLWRVYRRLLLRYADGVLCVSAAVARQFPPGRAEVLHNGFPEAEFARVDESAVAAFRQVHGGAEAVRIGLPGRIKLKRKGQEVFVAAVARLAPRYPQVRFLIVGAPFPGNESHEMLLRRNIRELGLDGRVTLTGEVAEPRIVISALDIVVLASGTPEPFGGVVIEAMACAKPVVATAIGGTVEQVVDGKTGLLVPPGDPEAMAAALARLIEDPELRERMGRAGRERFLQCFEFNGFYDQLWSFYRRCGRPDIRDDAHA